MNFTPAIKRSLLSLGYLLCALWLSGCALLEGSGLISGTVLFEDQFAPGQTGSWFIETDLQGQSIITNNTLQISVDTPQTIQYATLQNQTFGDFNLEVDVTQLAGSGNSSFGVLFRMVSNDAFYRFEITGNGLYIVEKRLPTGEWVRLIDDWTESPAILQGLNRTNRLRVEAEGSNLTFYANNQELATVVDASFPGGQIALDAGTFSQPGLKVAFDNIIIRSP